MAIVCPSCDARFRDPPGDVVLTRPLQCGKCDHKWRANGENSAADRDVVDAPAMVPSMDDLIARDDETIRTNLPVVVADAPDGAERAPGRREPIYVDVLEKPVEGHASGSTTLAMGVLTLVMLLGGLLLFRDAIMLAMPETVPYYRTAGFHRVAPGLEIANVVTTKSDKDGIRELIVKGEIANVAANTVPVPPIHLIMRDGSRANLYEWTVSASTPSLKAGERGRFTAIARDVPDGAVDVEVSFAR